VPVLGEAVRSTDTPLALVIAADQADRNRLVGSAGSLSYRAIAAGSVAAAADVIAQTPGVDLLLVEGDQAAINQAAAAAGENFKLASTPVVALADPQLQARIASGFDGDPRVTVVAAGQDDLGAAVALATAKAGNAAADSSANADAVALEALDLLARIATSVTVFDIKDAMPALRNAVADAQRPAVAARAGDVLALIDDAGAQATLASAAVSATGDVQPHLLQQAHGALALPTRNAVNLIVE